jgi:hypothetical protein
MQDAAEFQKMAAREIHRTLTLVVESSKTLLVSHGKEVLDTATLNEALRLAEQAQVSELLGLLRGKASTFVNKKDTTAYWAWIDAAGFYFDATGISWPYMTMNGRWSNLAFAQECAAEVQSVIQTVH